MNERENRYPDYDVLSKRDTPSWNAQTRRVIDERLAVRADSHEFLDAEEFAALRAICDCILPQPFERLHNVPIAALIDRKLALDERDGYRDYRLPPEREAWRGFLRAMNREAQDMGAASFADLDGARRNELLARAQKGLDGEVWRGLPSAIFFTKRLLPDVMHAYYGHPTAWSEIGFGGPASPRGYVRMGFDQRDPWEAAESVQGNAEERQRAEKENRSVGRT